MLLWHMINDQNNKLENYKIRKNVQYKINYLHLLFHYELHFCSTNYYKIYKKYIL